MDGAVSLYNGTVTPIIEFAPDDGLFAASPTWVEITDYVRSASCSSTSRTNELDDFQPGMFSAVLNNRERVFDPSYGPASVTFDGSGSDYWSCGDLAAFSGATELDVRACVSLDGWLPAASKTISAQQATATNQRCWQFYIDTSGFLALRTSSNGLASITASSGCRVSAVDGQTICVRATWDSSGAIYFYVKRTVKGREQADCIAHAGWVQLGAVKVGVTAALFNASSAVTVGDREGTTEPLDGVVYYADARTTVGGDTLAFAFWPKDAASTAATSWVSSETGETWTKTGSSTVAIQGPYFGRLTPGTPLRVRVTYNAVTYNVWYGYVRRWPQLYPQVGTDSVARVEAIDGLGWLAEKPAPETPFGIAQDANNRANALLYADFAPDPYWPLHEPYPALEFMGGAISAGGGAFVGDVAAGAITQPGAPTAPTRAFGPTTSQQAQAVALEGAATPGAGLYYSPSLSFWCDVPTATSQFDVVVENGLSFVADPVGAGASARTYAQYDDGGVFDQMAVVVPHLTPGPHHVYIRHDGIGSMTVLIDGTPAPGSVTSLVRATHNAYPPLWVSGYGSVGGGSVSDVTFGIGTQDASGYDAYYSGTGRPLELSGPRMEWLLTAAGIPSALQSVTTDVCTYLGPQPANTTYGAHCKSVETAENGRFYQAPDGVLTFRSHQWATTATEATTSQHTFGDGVGESPYTDLVVDPNNVDDIVAAAEVGSGAVLLICFSPCPPCPVGPLMLASSR